ncbi:hypothetical protein EVAR_68183_1 [Eumeta japonica]|uniref:Uncharacterized protein n=1 Tax=Eumeta variegata TaxID=151549 RepID=A0A4C2A1G4_EUMVA|nr:hypothetical protein EVAR_68183_1 [Eumeta japonica]
MKSVRDRRYVLSDGRPPRSRLYAYRFLYVLTEIPKISAQWSPNNKPQGSQYCRGDAVVARNQHVPAPTGAADCPLASSHLPGTRLAFD